MLSIGRKAVIRTRLGRAVRGRLQSASRRRQVDHWVDQTDPCLEWRAVAVWDHHHYDRPRSPNTAATQLCQRASRGPSAITEPLATLASSSGKRNVTVWRQSVRLSVRLSHLLSNFRPRSGYSIWLTMGQDATLAPLAVLAIRPGKPWPTQTRAWPTQTARVIPRSPRISLLLSYPKFAWPLTGLPKWKFLEPPLAGAAGVQLFVMA